jgi:hypothetical protein
MDSLLEGASHQGIIYTNHKNLTYFMIARVLNRCQPVGICYYLGLTLSSHIGTESNKGCLMLCQGFYILRQRKER